MGNEDNLKKITSTEQARKLGAKGGRARTLAKKLINRKFCNSKCPLFNNCWAKHTAYNLHEKAVKQAEKDGWPEEKIKKLKPECALRNLPTQIIEGAKRIIIDGETGFNNEMMEQIMRYKNDIMIGNITPREREKYLYQLRETKKSIYGDKSRIEGLPKEKSLTPDDFAEAYEISKKKRNEQKTKEISGSEPDKQTKGDQSGSEQSDKKAAN